MDKIYTVGKKKTYRSAQCYFYVHVRQRNTGKIALTQIQRLQQLQTSGALALWVDFRNNLCEDFVRNGCSVSFNKALLEIEDIFLTHNVTCTSLGLPTPTMIPEFADLDIFDPFVE